MQRHLADGIAAAEAAALATRPSVGEAPTALAPAAIRAELAAALSDFDETRADGVLDALLGAATLDAILSEVVVPYLRELGERWERGEASIAEEHFATGVLQGRRLGLARGWDRGLGPQAVLACAPGERHDLGLIAFGLALRSRGFRILYLGADTPIESVVETAAATEPAFVVVSSVDAGRFRAVARELRRLARRHMLCLGGEGAADAGIATLLLAGGPVDEADRLEQLALAPAR
jgi:methanogenic corrinoid protein MtbC1